MLKIKDSVDLKELEKFGFEKYSFANCYVKNISDKYDESTLLIKKDNKEIIIEHYQNEYGSTDICNLDILYDLIQAGLVEKYNKAK